METSQLFFLLIIGLIAGLVSGTMGVGGGVVIVPALVFFMGFTQHQAQGTSLVMMVPPIVAAGAYNYYKAGHVNLKFALILMVAFIVGSYLGSLFSVHISGRVLRKIFGFFMLAVALKMIFTK